MIQFKHATLDNGLQIVAEVDDTAHTSAIGFFVKTGARDEDSAIMGVSHFLEHMMFKGTEKRTAEDVDRDFDAIGANHNAYTTSELTAFYAHCLPEHLNTAEEVLSDIMRPSIRERDFDDEKKVIIEEIAMYQDQPFWVLYEAAMEAYYATHPLRHRVLGTEQTVTDLRRDEMMEYFQDRYSADNTTVALSGKLDFDAMCARLADHCGHWQTTDAARKFPEINVTSDSFTMPSSIAHLQYTIMLCPGPALGDDRRYAASMLMSILGDVEGSRLYWALVETGLTDEAQAQYNGRDGVGELLVYAAATPDTAEQIEAVIHEEIRTLGDALTEDDLERVRSKAATAVTLHGELPAGRMRRIGQTWTYLGKHQTLEEELALINAVTIDDLQTVINDFPMTNPLVGNLAPENAPVKS